MGISRQERQIRGGENPKTGQCPRGFQGGLLMPGVGIFFRGLGNRAPVADRQMAGSADSCLHCRGVLAMSGAQLRARRGPGAAAGALEIASGPGSFLT
jgi:hypothetical protein